MAENKYNLHANHRERMREKFLMAKDAMPDHEILEMLLFYAIPRKDTNLIAHKLLDEFRSLNGVFSASREALMSVEGVGDSVAFFLKLMPYAFQRLEREKHKATYLDSLEKIAQYLAAQYILETEESVIVLLLDERAKLVAQKRLFEGTVNMSSLCVQKISQFVLNYGAYRVVLAHNHPAGTAEPSDEDLSATRYLCFTLSRLGITLEEHFIIAGQSYCPLVTYMKEAKYI